MMTDMMMVIAVGIVNKLSASNYLLREAKLSSFGPFSRL
jgi:hypothetical protein